MGRLRTRAGGFAFEVIPRASAPHRPHRAALACATMGAGLVAASFPLAKTADRRYQEYLGEVNIARIEHRWQASVRADRTASASLLAGEALVATAAYLRFIRRPATERVALVVAPSRCAVCLRF